MALGAVVVIAAVKFHVIYKFIWAVVSYNSSRFARGRAGGAHGSVRSWVKVAEWAVKRATVTSSPAAFFSPVVICWLASQ